MNSELTNLLYCMLLENEYLQSKANMLHVKWINEAQCNWKKLWYLVLCFLLQLNLILKLIKNEQQQQEKVWKASQERSEKEEGSAEVHHPVHAVEADGSRKEAVIYHIGNGK